MKKKQQFPHRVQSFVSPEVFQILEKTRRQEDTTHAETVRHYIELGIQAEQQETKSDNTGE
jgi:hypothetical protein